MVHTYTDNITSLKGIIERINNNHSSAYEMLLKNLDFLTDTKYVYQ